MHADAYTTHADGQLAGQPTRRVSARDGTRDAADDAGRPPDWRRFQPLARDACAQAGGAASVAGALRAALKDGGPAALMRGASMRVVWIAPQGCIYYPAYELTLRLLSR